MTDTLSDYSSPQYTQVSNNITAPPPASSGIIPPPPPANFGSIPSQMSGGPPPPPPPVFGGHIPTMRLKSEISDRKEPPAAIQNAMMTKDKKPFTYTPGGIDLSEIRSPRMQKRIVRNQNAPDTHIPQADTTKPKPVLTPTAQAAMQPQVAFPVFPSGQVPLLPAYHGNQNNGSSNVLNQNFNVSSNPVSSTSPPPPTQQHIPPPPPQRSSQLLNSPLSEGQPKANLPWLQKAPQQKELPPWVHDSSETQYGVPAQQQIDGRNTPTLQQQQYNAPAPPHVTPNSQSSIQQQPRPTPQSQSNQTTTNNRWNQQQQNKPQESQWQQSSQPQKQGQTPQQDETPAQKQWQAKQQTEIPTQKQWQGLQQTPDAPVQKQWQGTQQTEAPTQKLWQPAPQPTEIPVQKQWQVLQKTEIPTQKPWQGLQQTEIPAQKQWQGNQQSTSNQQFKTPPNQNINNSQQWQTPPPPPQRSHTPQPQVQRSFMPQPQSQENQSQPGHHVRVIPIQIEGNGSQGRWSQPSPSSPQINGNGTPIQSKSFKVLQQVTNTGSEFQESDSFTIDGIPFSQFGNIQISNEGNAKSQENQYSRSQTDPRYTGDKIPSRSFRILQAITKSTEDEPFDMNAPFVQVPQVQVRIMTNVPRSAPQTPQPSDNASSQYSTEKSSSQTTKQFQGSTNASSHSYQVRQAVTSTQADGTEGERNWSYYSYPPPLPPLPLQYLPTSRPSYAPLYQSPIPSSPPISSTTPPPTPEQYQQMWQHFSSFYSYYYQQAPPPHFYFPPPPPYPGTTYSYSYPSDTEDTYSGYSSNEEMNGYFNNFLQKQRQYGRATQIESVENSENECETSDSEKQNDYQVKLFDEEEEDSEYPMTTSVDESFTGDHLSTIMEESELSDRRSQCSDCTLEKLSEDEESEETKSEEEVVFVKLPLSFNRKDEVTTLIVGSSSQIEMKNDEENTETSKFLGSHNCIGLDEHDVNSLEGDSNIADKSKTREYRHKNEDKSSEESESKANYDTNNENDRESNDNSHEQSKRTSHASIDDNKEIFKFVETFAEQKFKEKRIKNKETKISISYNGVTDEKIFNEVKKRTNRSTRSIYSSRLSGEGFDFETWSENEMSHGNDETVNDDSNETDNSRFKNNKADQTIHTSNIRMNVMNDDKSLTKHTIITHDLTLDDNEPNISVTIKFPIKTNLPMPNKGVTGIITENICKESKTKDVEPEMTSSESSRCDTPVDENSQISSKSAEDDSNSSSKCSGKFSSFLENLNSILQNINMSKSSERDNLEEGLYTSIGKDEGELEKRGQFDSREITKNSNPTGVINNFENENVLDKKNLSECIEGKCIEEILDTFIADCEGELEENIDLDGIQKTIINKTEEVLEDSENPEHDETPDYENTLENNNQSYEGITKNRSNNISPVDFWAEIGHSEERMHLSMSKSELFETVNKIASDAAIDDTLESNQDSHIEPSSNEMKQRDDIDNLENNEENTKNKDPSYDDELSEINSEKESETETDSSEDSSSSEDSTSSSSSGEEDEEEGRTFVFYHEDDQKEQIIESENVVTHEPVIRIESNETCEKPEGYLDKHRMQRNDKQEFEQEDKERSQNVISVNKFENKCDSVENRILIESMENTSNNATRIEVHTLNVQEKIGLQSLDESEEDDSGVTSDISRHISETDTDHDQEFSELKKMSAYKRANTHSRLYQLLQNECEIEHLDQPSHTNVPRKESLSLPLRSNSIDNSNVSTPTSPISDKLVKELVQSLLSKKKGRIFRNLPIERLHAAAIRILQEDVDYDTFSSTSGESSLLESPAEHSPSVTPLQRSLHRGSGAYSNYNEYYDSWAAASIQDSLGSDIIPSRAFKILQEHVKPGTLPGFIEGLQAKCPKVSSSTNLSSVLEGRDSLTPVPENVNL